MKKNMVVAAIAVALATPLVATPLVANAEAIMYGQLRVSTQTASRSDINGSWGMADQQSRLGVKGSEDLGNGLKAIYQLEFGVGVGNGFTSGNTANDFWTERDSFVGIGSAFGTVLMGRHDTPMKMSTAKLDFFRDTNADNDTQSSFDNGLSATGVGLFDSRRVNGAIAYVSPNLAGFSLVGAAVQHNANDTHDDAQAFAGAYSVAGIYSNGPWFATAAYETIDLSNFGDGFKKTPVYNKWRVGLGMLDFNNISVSAIYEERYDEMTTAFPDKRQDSNSWQLQAAYNLPGGMRVKGMYGQFDGVDKDQTIAGLPNFDVWALGIEYNLSKRTDIQMIYRAKTYDVNDAALKGIDATDDVFAVQLDHSF